jgi:hypothetical protein
MFPAMPRGESVIWPQSDPLVVVVEPELGVLELVGAHNSIEWNLDRRTLRPVEGEKAHRETIDVVTLQIAERKVRNAVRVGTPAIARKAAGGVRRVATAAFPFAVA